MKKFSSSMTAFILVLATGGAFAMLNPHTVAAQDCGAPVPSAPANIKAVSGSSAGQVILYWDASPYADRYALAYGTSSNKYIYGADNIGGEKSRSYTVKSLKPGVKYYFRLAAARDCSSSPYSTEVFAVAAGREKEKVEQKVSKVSKVEQVVKAKKVSPSGPVGKQALRAVAGPGVGEVTLTWQHADSADNYHLVYGEQHGKYKYGALNLGRVNRFTVKKLQLGKEYHFALVVMMGERPLYTTAQVMAKAYGGVEVVQTTREALRQPKPKSPPDLSISVPPQATGALEPTTPAGL